MLGRVSLKPRNTSAKSIGCILAEVIIVCNFNILLFNFFYFERLDNRRLLLILVLQILHLCLYDVFFAVDAHLVHSQLLIIINQELMLLIPRLSFTLSFVFQICVSSLDLLAVDAINVDIKDTGR